MTRSRCDWCGRRIGPNRYELGLCHRCEPMIRMVETFVMLGAFTMLLQDPVFVEVIEKSAARLVDTIKLVTEP